MKLKTRVRYMALIEFIILTFVVFAGNISFPAKAASGTLYSCTINRCYSHPVTGEIEDSGGEASYTTGQGMVEGCVASTGLLEVTADGSYYLTIRMSLMDYTSKHDFKVQNVGDTAWTSLTMGVTNTGSDTNGSTSDYCIQVPSENCIVRGSMYVEPMGRTVIFYLYPSDFTEGNSTDMKATIVTETVESSESGSDSSDSSSDSAAGDFASSNTSDSTENQTANGSESEDSISNTTGEITEDTASEDSSTDTTIGNSTITDSNTSDSEDATDSDSALDSQAGLSLSTATENDSESNTNNNSTVGTEIFTQAAAITIAGLILITVTSIIVYYFRKNWYRWGGVNYGDDDDE